MSVSGWLFKITTAGLEPDTRPMINWWASWHPDQGPALEAIKKRTGPCDPPADARTLTEEQLKKMGLSGPGDVKNVKTEF